MIIQLFGGGIAPANEEGNYDSCIHCVTDAEKIAEVADAFELIVK